LTYLRYTNPIIIIIIIKMATNYTCLSVIANRIIGLCNVYYSVVKVTAETNVATVLMRRVRDELKRG